MIIAVCFASTELFHFILADLYGNAVKEKFALNSADPADSKEILIKKALYHRQTDPEYQHLYAKTLYARANGEQDFSTARDLLRQAKEGSQRSLELNPREGNVWLDLAQICWWLGNFRGCEEELANAEGYFLQAVATDPNNGKFLYALVNYYLSSARSDGGATYLERLASVYAASYYPLKEHPHWSQTAREHFKSGLRTALANDLTVRQANSVLALMAAEEKDWRSAVAYTRESIRHQGSATSSQPYLDLGRYLLPLAEYDQAKDALLQGLKLSTNRQQVLENLLSPCLETGSFSLYVQLCRDTASFDGTVRNSLTFLLGKACFAYHRLDLAEAYLRESVQTHNRGEAHRYLAEIAERRNDWDTMELESQRATLLDPGKGYYQFLLARSLAAQKKYKSALEHLNQAIHNTASPQEGYFEMQGALCWSLQDYHGAVKAWQTAHQLAPENPRHLRKIAEAYWRLSDYCKAENYYVSALQFSPEDEQLRRELEQLKKEHNQ